MFILPGWGEGEEVKKEVDLGGGVGSLGHGDARAVEQVVLWKHSRLYS